MLMRYIWQRIISLQKCLCMGLGNAIAYTTKHKQNIKP